MQHAVRVTTFVNGERVAQQTLHAQDKSDALGLADRLTYSAPFISREAEAGVKLGGTLFLSYSQLSEIRDHAEEA